MIRQATDADASALGRLLWEFDRVELTAAQTLERLRSIRCSETVFLAELDGVVAGFCSVHLRPWLTSDHPFAELTELFVLPEWRRRGLATALVRQAEGLARARGAQDMVLLTGFQNAAAQAFYRAVGYGDYCLAMRRKPL